MSLYVVGLCPGSDVGFPIIRASISIRHVVVCFVVFTILVFRPRFLILVLPFFSQGLARLFSSRRIYRSRLRGWSSWR